MVAMFRYRRVLGHEAILTACAGISREAFLGTGGRRDNGIVAVSHGWGHHRSADGTQLILRAGGVSSGRMRHGIRPYISIALMTLAAAEGRIALSGAGRLGYSGQIIVTVGFDQQDAAYGANLIVGAVGFGSL